MDGFGIYPPCLDIPKSQLGLWNNVVRCCKLNRNQQMENRPVLPWTWLGLSSPSANQSGSSGSMAKDRQSGGGQHLHESCLAGFFHTLDGYSDDSSCVFLFHHGTIGIGRGGFEDGSGGFGLVIRLLEPCKGDTTWLLAAWSCLGIQALPH